MISVAVITYNHEKYIHYALDSILSQNFDMGNIEIVIGDDGSKDSTVDILMEYTKKYDFIRVQSHDNVGISKNIYQVFTECKGDYIAVLEGDDYWIDSEKLNKQLSILYKNDCIATASNLLIVDQNNKPSEGKLHEDWDDHIITKKEIEKYQTKLFLPSSLMFKNIFLESGDKYTVIRDASKYGGSHSGMINLLGSIGSIYYCSECLSTWRKVTSGGSNYSSAKRKNINFYYDQLCKYFVYKDEFKMNYNKPIRTNYYDCIYSLNDEMIEKIGKGNSLINILYAFIHSIYHIIKK